MPIKRRQHRRGSPLYVTPSLELLFVSAKKVKKNLGIFALLYFFPLVIGLSNGYWVVDTTRHLTPDTLDAATAVGNSTLPAYAYGRLTVMFIGAIIIAVVTKIMLNAAQLSAADDKKISLRPLWMVVRTRGLQFLSLYVATTALTVVWLIPAFLFRDIVIELICFIPAALMLRRYFVAPYVLLENHNMTIWQAMQKSAEITHRDSLSVYTMIGVMLLFALFGIVPIIGWIAAFALLFYYSAAPAIRYLELKRLS